MTPHINHSFNYGHKREKSNMESLPEALNSVRTDSPPQKLMILPLVKRPDDRTSPQMSGENQDLSEERAPLSNRNILNMV